MYDAQTINSQGAGTTTLFSPWFPRGGDYGIFAVELIAGSGTTNALVLKAELYHKNSDDPGDGDPVNSGVAQVTRDGTQIGTIGSTDVDDGFKELVRYKFSLAVTSGSGAQWATFRTLAPTWYDKV